MGRIDQRAGCGFAVLRYTRIWRKIFYFYAYDQQHRDFPADATPQSPEFYALIANQTALLKNNRGLSQTQINTALGYLSSLGGVLPRQGDQIINFPKLDWVRGRQHASLQYNRMRWSSPGGVQTGTVVSRGLASFGSDYAKVDSVLARWQVFVTPRLMNELRFQYSRDFESEIAQTPLAQEPADRARRLCTRGADRTGRVQLRHAAHAEPCGVSR